MKMRKQARVTRRSEAQKNLDGMYGVSNGTWYELKLSPIPGPEPLDVIVHTRDGGVEIFIPFVMLKDVKPWLQRIK